MRGALRLATIGEEKLGVILAASFLGIFFCAFFFEHIGVWRERITVRENRRRHGCDTFRSGTMTYIPQYTVWHACNTL
jgi:hypothetical protein